MVQYSCFTDFFYNNWWTEPLLGAGKEFILVVIAFSRKLFTSMFCIILIIKQVGYNQSLRTEGLISE